MASNRLGVLEVGSDVITLVLQDNKRIGNIFFKGQAAYDGYQDGEFLNEASLFGAIESLVNECNGAISSPITSLIVGIPGEFTAVVCKNVAISLKEKRQVTQNDIEALLHEGDTYKNHAAYTTINSSPIHYVANRMQTHDVASLVTDKLSAYISYILCEKSVISIFDAIADRLKLSFIYSSTILSQVLYLIDPKKRDEGVILCDIGYISSTVCYAKGDGILHSLSFSRGIGHIAANLLTNLQIPFEHAMELLAKINLNIKPEEDDVYTLNIDKKQYSYNMLKVNEIAAYGICEIGEIIKSALERSKVEIVEGIEILLTGSGATGIFGTKEILQEITNRPTSVVSSNVLQFTKPSQSGIASLILMQRERFVNISFFDKISMLFSRIRRKKV